jgi:hypothetical protein
MIRRSFVALALVAGLSAPGAPAAAKDRPAVVQAWRVKCERGRDEFAIGCTATTVVGDLMLELTTDDSQLFLGVTAAACPQGFSAQANYWRTDLAALSPKARQRKVTQAFEQAIQAVARDCLRTAPPTLQWRWLPDIAAVGDPPPTWAGMSDTGDPGDKDR